MLVASLLQRKVILKYYSLLDATTDVASVAKITTSYSCVCLYVCNCVCMHVGAYMCTLLYMHVKDIQT